MSTLYADHEKPYACPDLSEDSWGYVLFDRELRWVGPAHAEVDYWKARALAAEAKLQPLTRPLGGSHDR